MSDPLISRVYSLSIAGYDDALKQVNALTVAFQQMDETKKALNTQLQQKITSGDQDVINQLTQKIKDLEAEMDKLKLKRDSAAKEAALLAKAEKDTADALLKTELATVATAKAQQIRVTTTIQQNKELERQAALEELQKEKLDREKQSVEQLQQSYNDLKNQRLELEKITAGGNTNTIYSVNGQTLNYSDALSQITQLKTQEDELIQKINLEKTSREEVNNVENDKLAALRLEKTELQQIVAQANAQNTSIIFKGQNLTNDEALAQIKLLEQAETELSEKRILQSRQADTATNQIINAEENEIKTVVTLEESYNNLKNQRIALQQLLQTGTKSSTFNIDGQSYNYDEAISKIKELKTQEQAFTDQLKIEKSVHTDINTSQQESLNSIQQQRKEIETLINNNTQQGTVISFSGESLNQDEAISKINELRTQEQLLIKQVNEEKNARQSITVVEEGSLNAIRAQRIELEQIISNTNKNSTVSFGGQNYSYTDAIAQLQQLKTEEAAYTEQLRLEKNVHVEITTVQEGSIAAIKQQRQILESLVSNTTLGGAINFQGQTVQYDEAIAKIKELKIQEQQFTDSLKVEKTLRDEEKKSVDVLEGSYNAIKQQRIALEKLTANANSSSVITFNGQSFNFDDAVSQIKLLKAQEIDYTEKLQLEKNVHDSINKAQQESLLLVKQQRLELETLVNNSVNSSIITTGGQSLNLDESIAQVKELQAQETILTEKLNNERSIQQSIIREDETKLALIREQRLEVERLTGTSDKTSNVSFNGQSLSYTDAVEKMQQLNAEEALYTEKLKTEKVQLDSINASRQTDIDILISQRQELESFISSAKSNNFSQIDVGGTSFNYDEAISKSKELQLQEQQLINKYNAEKDIQASIITSDEERLIIIKEQRLQLENLISGSDKTSNVSFNNQSLSQSEAVNQLRQLNAEETALNEKLTTEKNNYSSINELQQQSVLSIRQKRAELDNFVKGTKENTSVTFNGQTFNYDEALAKIKELQAQEKLLTDSLVNEKTVRQSINIVEDGSLNAVKAERIELEKIISNSNKGSAISFQGQTYTYDEAISKLKVLKSEELDFTEKLKLEKNVHEQITRAEDGSLAALKQERIELQALITNSSKDSTISFRGQSFSNDEAISRLKELKTQEQAYIDQLKVEKETQAQTIKSLQEKINLTRLEKLELETIVSQRNQTSTVSFKGSTFNYDEAIAKIQELNALESQYTEKLNVENILRQNSINKQQESIDITRRQIIELQTLVSSKVNSSSSISFNGQSFNNEDALIKIQELEAQEKLYTDQLNIEKNTQAGINNEQLEKINLLRQERIELESIVKNSQQQTTVSLRGQDFNYVDAIEKIKILETEENKLTSELEQQGVQTKTLSNNYYSLLAAQKQALDLHKLADIDSPAFEQIKQNAIDATNKVQAFNRALSPDGTLVGEYKTGIVNAFRDLGLTDVLKTQRQEIQNNLDQLKRESQELATEYRQTGTAGQESFQKIDQQLRLNLEQQEQMKKSLLTLDSALSHTGGVGSQITTSIAEGFKNAKVQLSQLLVGYLGFQAVFNGLQTLVNTDIKLSDSIAQLKIYIHGTTEEATDLVDALKKIPTRTSLPNLVDIATSVAQKGVAKEQIGEVTQAFDELFTALGKDAGDPHEGVLTIAKLISIFHDDHQVTAERVKELGNAMFTLQSSGPVSGAFLQGYAERVGAVRSITGATIPQILGMAAAYQQLGQTEETAGSATSILLTKLISNVEKFANVSGISVDKLRAVVKENPFEALLEVAEKLKTKGADGVESIVKLVGDLGVNNVRARGAFAELINNADLFRTKMQTAGAAITNTAGLLIAFDDKQNTFAGTVAKIGNAFTSAFANKTFLEVLNSTAKVLLSIIQIITAIPFSVIVGGITAMSAAWLFYKGNLTYANLAQMANNEATLLGYVRLNLLKSGLFGAAAAENARAISTRNSSAAIALKVAALNSEIAAERSSIAALEAKIIADEEQSVVLGGEIAARRAHVIALEGEIAATEAATVATDGLNVATKVSPLGIILGVIALLVPVMSAFGNATKKTTDDLNEQNKQLKLNAEIQSEVAKQVADSTAVTVSHVTELVSILQDQTNNTYLLKQAYDALISIAPEFAGVFDGEKVNIEKLNELYPIYIANLKAVSEAKALATIRDKFAQDKANANVEAFQAKLKADQEIRDNATIEAKNKGIRSANQVAVQGGAQVDISLLDQGNTIPTSDEAQKDYEQKQAAAKAAADKSAGLDAYLGKDIKDREQRIATLTTELSKLKEGTEQYNTVLSQLETEKKALLAVTGISSTPPTTTTDDGGKVTLEQLKATLADDNKKIAALDQIKNKTLEQLDQLKKLRKDRADVLKEIKELNAASGTNTRGSRLTGQENDKIKDIDAQADQQKADLELAYSKKAEFIRADNSKVIINNEQTYLKELLKINEEAINEKLSKLSDSNAAERLLRAKLKLEIITDEDDTNKKLFDLEKKRLDNALESINKENELQLKTVQDDPNKTNVQKAAADENYYTVKYLATFAYYQKLSSLDKKYNQLSVEDEQKRKDALSAIITEENIKEVKDYEAKLKDINDATDEDVAKIKLKYDKLKQDVLNSDQSPDDKKDAIDKLDKVENVAVDSRQLIGQNSQVTEAQKLFAAGKITAEDFEKIFNGAIAAQQKLNGAIEDSKIKVTNLNTFLQSSLRSLLSFNNFNPESKALAQAQKDLAAGKITQQAFDATNAALQASIDKKKALQELFAQTTADAFATAQTAMNDYFDSEKQQIDRSNQLTQKRLDIELQQAQARAQSQAESDSLARQYAQKKADADHDAFEKNKKIQIEQAKINLAIQLSNLAVIAFAPGPANIATLGVAGAIMYAVQAALALVNYELNVNKIQSAQYAKGGRVQPEPVGNGRITTRPNITPLANGDNIYATVKTNEVILNEEQQQRAGGPAFFKSLGVPGFGSGGHTGGNKIASQTSVTDTSTSAKKSSIDEMTVDTSVDNLHEGIQNYIKNIQLKYQALADDINESKVSKRSKASASETLKAVERMETSATLLTDEMYSVHAIKRLVENKYLSYTNNMLNLYDKATAIHTELSNHLHEARKNVTTHSLFSSNVRKLFSSLKEKNESKIVSEIVTNAFNEAQQSIHQYFTVTKTTKGNHDLNESAKNKNIEESNSTIRSSGMHTSESESDKNIYISKIALASFEPSFMNRATFGAAGAMEYKVKSSFAPVKSNVAMEQYVSGGYTGRGTKRDSTGQKVAGVVHEDEWVSPKWMVNHPKYGPVISELEDVRKRGSSISNTTETKLSVQEVFSTKGKPFAVGGYTGIGDFPLGDNLQAPINPQAYLNPQATSSARTEERINSLMDIVANTSAAIMETSRQTNKRIDKLQVNLDPNAVAKANNKTNKATAIGRL